ncbi:asparagine synthetase B family protein [Thiohalorhabdus sp.]|uniref:asparagine synthetase B family protein n=1 Tax=Thiohalorhabdus sp. TaxID=3094134 RepID=UPI002FC2EB23
MKGLWGWLDQGTTGDPEALLRGLDPDPGNSTPSTLVRERSAMAGRAWQGMPLAEEETLLVGLVGHAWWADSNTHAAPADVARAYRARGSDFLAALQGPFLLTLLDPQSGAALLAADRMGVWDLAYAPTPGGLLFGPRADRLAVDPRCAADLDPQGLYDYLYYHVIPRPGSAYQGIFRLRPGEVVTFRDGELTAAPFWRPSFSEDRRTPVAELQERFRTTVRNAVARSAQEGRVGAFLSGGTDSSTITGMLGEVTGEPPRTFAIGFNAEGYDETGFAHIAAKRFGADHHEYFVTPQDVARAVPEIAAAYGEPYGNASVVPSFYCARLARENGVDVLLGGDGGDELFAGNERYARQWLLSLYHRVPRSLRRGLLEPATGLPGAERVPPVRKLASYIRQASLPMPQRLQTYNLLEYLGPERVFAGDFLAGIDRHGPIRELTREYRDLERFALVNQLLAIDMKYTLADDDLRKVTRAGELAGVETRFPFLDDEVVAFAATVPVGQKMRRTRLRHFFKQALRDYLPEEILTKEKHGFGLPFGVWLREEPVLRDLARDSLDGLRGRGIIRAEMIDELTGRRLEEHPGFFGTLTWVLMMLEQWLRHNGGRA